MFTFIMVLEYISCKTELGAIFVYISVINIWKYREYDHAWNKQGSVV